MRAVAWLRKHTLCKLGGPFFFFHRARVIEEYDSENRKLQCMDCDQYFAMSDRLQAVLPWDDEFEKITCLLYGVPRTKK